MIRKKILLTSMLLLIVSLAGCSSVAPVDSVARPNYANQIVDDESFRTYMGRISMITTKDRFVPLLVDMYVGKARDYCVEHKLSDGDCKQLESDLEEHLRLRSERYMKSLTAGAEALENSSRQRFQESMREKK